MAKKYATLPEKLAEVTTAFRIASDVWNIAVQSTTEIPGESIGMMRNVDDHNKHN